MKKVLFFAGSALIFATAGFITWGYIPIFETAVPVFCNEEYVFLNPSLRCSPAEMKREYVMFKERLQSYIRDAESTGNVQSVAVYFRDLENGPWFGIEEDELFSPASTMKVPLMIAYYKQVEEDPGILERSIEIGNTAPSDDETVQEGSLQDGGTYTIDELLRRMIVYSDNAPLHILFGYIKQFSSTDDFFAGALAEMGMAKSEGSVDDYMTVKRYASVYRVLYNASYLSKKMSQQALELLTRSASPQGIQDGVPAGVPVAHKFGLRSPKDAAVQLHDCGIVYYPENHYILCIMTKGKDVPTLSSVIREIASMIHEEVVSRSL